MHSFADTGTNRRAILISTVDLINPVAASQIGLGLSGPSVDFGTADYIECFAIVPDGFATGQRRGVVERRRAGCQPEFSGFQAPAPWL